MNSFYSEDELAQIGFKEYGQQVLISRKTSIYSPHKMTIGDNVRIDDFCILSGDITLGSHIHIAAYCALYGTMGIKMESYSGLSSRVVIYSAMDDLSGNYMAGPNQKEGTTNVQGGEVCIGKYVIVGTNCTIFPKLTIEEGAVVGSHSLVNKSIKEWTINFGCPAKYAKDRDREMLKFIK